MKTQKKGKIDWIIVLLILVFLAGIGLVVQAILEQKAEISSGMSAYQKLAEAVSIADELPQEQNDQEEEMESIQEVPVPELPPAEFTDKNVLGLLEVPDEQPMASKSPIETPPSMAEYSLPDATERPEKGSIEKQHTQSGVDLAACQQINADFIAWLRIPGTKINYPVVRSDHVEHYLTHTFSGKKNKIGTLFSLAAADYETPGRNICIYGHHITTGGSNMFQPLVKYKEASFCANHPLIYLDSLYHSDAYRIAAVFNYHDGSWDAAKSEFTDDAGFLTFIVQAKAQALYDTGLGIQATDQVLSLITCDREYNKADGRLVVMAVRVQEDE